MQQPLSAQGLEVTFHLDIQKKKKDIKFLNILLNSMAKYHKKQQKGTYCYREKMNKKNLAQILVLKLIPSYNVFIF
jgi:hypothetical protein